MATDFARDLEDQLVKTKAALQDQAEEMLSLLLQFEARLQERLDAAEARIAALRASYAQMSQDEDFAMARPTTEEPARAALGTDWTG